MSSRAFVIRFIVILLIGFALVAPPLTQLRILQPFTEWLAAATTLLLNGFGHEVSRAGTTIFSSGFAVDLRNGCNGVEGALILFAAILASPAGWRAKGIGVFGGFVLLQGINLIRISSLYLLGKHNPELFDLFHSAVWQVVIILASVLIFLAWSVRIARPDHHSAA